jgi:hypothetical protein
VVAANRASDGRLALGREVREIAAALRSAVLLKFDVRILWAASHDEFRDAFLDFDPHILHFCGHGTESGPVLEGTDPGTESIAGKALQRWLTVALKDTKLEIAVLNFCYSHEMLDALKDTAPIVIGPTRTIVDEHAVVFSSVFYMALANGGSGSFAYHLATSAVQMMPVQRAVTRDVPQPPLPPQPGQYGIRCARDGELPVVARAGPLSDRRTFAFFASEPEALPRLCIDQELRRILRRPPSPKRFRIEQRWATRPLDFMHTLIATRPNIVHISGHGANGSFRFEHDRYPQGVSAECQVLARVLAAFHQDIDCAVLMFSDSHLVARELNSIIGSVVSLSGSISNTSAIRFSEIFYPMIWYGRQYQVAFNAAIDTLAAESSDSTLFALRGRVQNGDR